MRQRLMHHADTIAVVNKFTQFPHHTDESHDAQDHEEFRFESSLYDFEAGIVTIEPDEQTGKHCAGSDMDNEVKAKEAAIASEQTVTDVVIHPADEIAAGRFEQEQTDQEYDDQEQWRLHGPDVLFHGLEYSKKCAQKKSQ